MYTHPPLLSARGYCHVHLLSSNTPSVPVYSSCLVKMDAHTYKTNIQLRLISWGWAAPTSSAWGDCCWSHYFLKLAFWLAEFMNQKNGQRERKRTKK